MGWAEIKKAINSNLSKPLDVLIDEKINQLRTLIITKSTGQYPVLRDTGYLLVSNYSEDIKTERKFQYSGSAGQLLIFERCLEMGNNGYANKNIQIIIDGKDITNLQNTFQTNTLEFMFQNVKTGNRNIYVGQPSESVPIDRIHLPIEFKNSFEIKLPSYYVDNKKKCCRCLFKTEK